MSLAKIAVAAAALSLMIGATVAQAKDQPETTFGCMNMDRQFKEALNANAQSPNVDAAKAEGRRGLDACLSSYYRVGIAHYKKAMELLTHT